jgi:hydroxyethylthiazole kinase-like uncharacterized protein yjeF
MPPTPLPDAGQPSADAPALITPDLLRRWPLPLPDDDADKEGRGRVLVVGGSPEMPGAVILAATAALRAGAGKLQIATCRDIAHLVAVEIPEARVFALPQTAAGGIEPSAAEQIAEHAARAQATLIGPGLLDGDAVNELVQRLLPQLGDTSLILDAEALMCVEHAPAALHRLQAPPIVTPHAGEMARMLGREKQAIQANPAATARQAAAALRAVVALKGRETYISHPDGTSYRNQSGNVGLATSGSGDTLSGIVAGLAARGATPLQATAWGVHLHASAGDALAERIGLLGFLARELLAEIPGLMARLSAKPDNGA